MDQKTLYEKAEKAINQAFEATKKSLKAASEKAEEAAHITKLIVEKVALEHKVSKKFAELGSRIYSQAQREGKSISLTDSDIKSLIDQTKKLDSELAQVEANLEIERKAIRKSKTSK